MSTTKTAARRIALLASSSLGLAAIISAASLGAVLTPTAAFAADECTPVVGSGTSTNGSGPVSDDPTLNGDDPDSFACTAASYTTGTTYTSDGDLSLTTTVDAAEWGGNGIVLTAGADDDAITFSTAVEIEGRSLVGALLDVTTVDGTINIATEEVDADAHTAGGVTHGIRAISDTGAISITSTGTVAVASGGPDATGIEAITDGAITMSTASVTTNGDGIYAQSTGGGNINLSAGAVGFGSAAGSTAIEAISNGGNISITTTGQVGTNASNLTQATTNRDGVVVQTSGAGEVNLTLGGLTKGFGVDGAAVRVTNGTGDVNIVATGQIRGGETDTSSDAQLGSGIVIDSDGDITIASSSLIIGAVNETGVQPAAIVANGQTFTLTLTGNANVNADDVQNYTASLGGTKVSDLTGFGYTGDVNTSVPSVGSTGRQTGGHIDLSGVTGGAELNFNSQARWVVSGSSVMSGAGDTVNLDATSAIMTTMMGRHAFSLNGFSSSLLEDVNQEIIKPGIVDFGAGEDTLNNAGRIFIGSVFTSGTQVGEGIDIPAIPEKRFGVRGEARLLNLEQFNNSGEIWLGARFHFAEGGSWVTTLMGTDLWHDDMLYMPGATLHGEDGSIVYLDVDLNQAQSSCAPSTRDSNGYLPAADCIGLQGGAATGRTELRIYEQIPGDRGAYNPDGIVLVDLAGGDPDATDPLAFFLSPDTPRYIDLGNGGIEKGVFAYILGFDADTQQFKLVGAPSSGAQQFPILATAANQLWQTATGGWFERRVHQRDVGHEGLGTGAWFNATGTGIERDIATPIEVGTSSVTFDNSYEQSDVTISFGWDLLDYGSNAALGAMVGYAHSEVEFDDSDNSANLEGVHAGFYGGYGIGGFWIDGAVNGAILSLHNDVPAMNLTPAGTVLDTEVWSLGGRVEAGWRWDAGYGLWVEPLVGFSAVSTSFEDFRVPNGDPDPNRPGVDVRLDAADSRRASAGLRVGMQDLWTNVAPTSFSLTARAVNEFEGGADVSVENVGPTYLSTDALEGTFTQLTGSVSVSTPDKAFSGYLNVDSTFADEYESLGASIGVRLHW